MYLLYISCTSVPISMYHLLLYLSKSFKSRTWLLHQIRFVYPRHLIDSGSLYPTCSKMTQVNVVFDWPSVVSKLPCHWSGQIGNNIFVLSPLIGPIDQVDKPPLATILYFKVSSPIYHKQGGHVNFYRWPYLELIFNLCNLIIWLLIKSILLYKLNFY